ncbi:hypothetical protein RJ53_04160 [Methanocalculus chunghsingensis]|uniref:Flavin reductase like domain-containing protein n=1 Tax=Methanocalculus chunghsingensis TaxID=156457 RepID=A0A8J7W8T4_9EURY|nr:flavin reductase family protein [Methanocalculus chunghsingensis]MBR1368745.1 hypothetical protein [Methanocalculus chunghsingensis]
MKTAIGQTNALYPSLTLLIGARVNGKPNFLTVAHAGVIDETHLMISLAATHHTTQGILEHREFSVNIPDSSLLEETDYCGIVSGKKTDKADLFTVEYGDLEYAPLIRECPVSMECRVTQTMEQGRYLIFIGEIRMTYADDGIRGGRTIDPERLRPILFAMSTRGYYGLAGRLGNAWDVGMNLPLREREASSHEGRSNLRSVF